MAANLACHYDVCSPSIADGFNFMAHSMKTRTLAAVVGLWLCLGTVLPALAQGTRVTVNELVVTGNTLLAPETLNAALAPYKGERTLEELNQAAQVVQDLYRKAGYGAVIAYVPPQSGEPGRATIAVLEGRIVRIEVIGNSQFSEDNVRRSLPLLTLGTTPHLPSLDEQIQLANQNPARQLALTLEAGKLPGEVEARVTVTEVPASRWSVSLDNTGNSSTGNWRAYLGYQHAALWDLDHVLSVQLGTSPEKPAQVASIGANYHVPFYDKAMTLDVVAAYSNVDNGNTTTVAGPLQFNGQGGVLGLRLNKYLQRSADFDQVLSLGLDTRLYLNNCNIAGLPSGACGSSGEDVTVLPITFGYSVQKGGMSPYGANVSASYNLGLGVPNGSAANFDAVRAGAPEHYTLVRLGAYGTLPLANQWQLQARLNGQLTPDALIPGEQFGIAGANGVRGYLEREIIGDYGVLGSVELYAPGMQLPFNEQQALVQLLGFFDAGKVWNHLDTPCLNNQTSCPLASAGVGARVGLGGLQLRIDVAYAMKNGSSTQSGDVRANFLATYTFN
jgi:hemolysin activation/secretion protein